MLKHLRDHCPNLRALAITVLHLKSFHRSFPVLYSLLERLERFSVTWHKARRGVVDLLPPITAGDVTDSLLQLFYLSDTLLNVKHVSLDFPIVSNAKLNQLM
jgi:hypothetical protein